MARDTTTSGSRMLEFQGRYYLIIIDALSAGIFMPVRTAGSLSPATPGLMAVSERQRT